MITLNSYCAMMVTTSLRKASYHPRPSHNTSNLLESESVAGVAVVVDPKIIINFYL